MKKILIILLLSCIVLPLQIQAISMQDIKINKNNIPENCNNKLNITS